jgi:integrase/recombinase XerC
VLATGRWRRAEGVTSKGLCQQERVTVALVTVFVVALRDSLVTLKAWRGTDATPERPIVHVKRRRGYSAAAVAVWFYRLYTELGFTGASSHSGRRTFITKAAKQAVEAGGSLRDVQQLAGHSSLATTQRYIEGDTEAKRKLVNLI